MKDSPQKPQVKKGKPVSMDKKNEETVAVEKAEESSTAQVSDSRQAGASERDADTKDSQVAGLLAEATHLLRSMRPSLKAVKLSSLEKGMVIELFWMGERPMHFGCRSLSWSMMRPSLFVWSLRVGRLFFIKL